MKSILLLSAGLDSAVSMAVAARETEIARALTLDYGQRAAAREIEQSRRLASHFGVAHEVIRLDFLARLTATALVNSSETVPEPDEGDLDDVRGRALDTARKVWVPNRNGLFINIAAAFAEALGAELIVTGFNAEEAATFPDNTPQFVEAANQALAYSTLNRVRVVSYTQNLSKAEIVDLGAELGVPFEHIWSCYHGAERMCGRCESCRRLIRALKCSGRLEILDKLFESGR